MNDVDFTIGAELSAGQLFVFRLPFTSGVWFWQSNPCTFREHGSLRWSSELSNLRSAVRATLVATASLTPASGQLRNTKPGVANRTPGFFVGISFLSRTFECGDTGIDCSRNELWEPCCLAFDPQWKSTNSMTERSEAGIAPGRGPGDRWFKSNRSEFNLLQGRICQTPDDI